MGTAPTSIGTWINADAGTTITYSLCTTSDTIEFTFEGLPQFNLIFEEPALADCITIFTEALTNYRAAVAEQ